MYKVSLTLTNHNIHCELFFSLEIVQDNLQNLVLNVIGKLNRFIIVVQENYKIPNQVCRYLMVHTTITTPLNLCPKLFNIHYQFFCQAFLSTIDFDVYASDQSINQEINWPSWEWSSLSVLTAISESTTPYNDLHIQNQYKYQNPSRSISPDL